jgi:hypothetical protein
VTVSAAAATQLAITTQPSATAQSGAAFTQQPVIQVRDASNLAVNQAGMVVTASIASGGGTLGGTATATTNASGVAAFTSLQITGTAGTRTLTFSATGLTSVTSTAIAVSVPSTPPVGGLYPNRPAAFTKSSEIDFTQALPPMPDDVNQPIAGTSWFTYGTYSGPVSAPIPNWTRTTDASAPQSAPGIWQGHFAPGSYGGGVIGQGGGHGIGDVVTPTPNITRLYMSTRVYFDFDPADWHPISNKFVIIEGNNGSNLILVQLRENGDWRHAEELGPSGSFYVDGGTDFPGEDHIPGQLDNRAVPTRQWVQIEILIDLPGHVFKVWQDGVLTTNATPTFASTFMNTVGVHAFRGGGGETITKDLYWRYDHFFIAW